MSDDLSQMERVSSFMDGEAGEVPEVLCTDNAAKGCWRRYHLIREVLRDSKPACLSGRFNARLMQALENEPVIMAPRLLKPRNRLPARLLKPAAGLAIAATVAAVAVVGFQNLGYPPGVVNQPRTAATDAGVENDINTGVATGGGSRNVQLADAPASRPAPAVNQRTFVSAPGGTGEERQADDSLNGYLLEHMEQSTGGHAPGMLPYVRLAGYENNR